MRFHCGGRDGWHSFDLGAHALRSWSCALHAQRLIPWTPFQSSPCSVFEAELADHIPVVKASVAGTRLVGRLVVGNKNGLLLPNTTSDQGWY